MLFKGRYARFLFDSYKPPCMYFEVIECVRKLLLTGMLIFFFPRRRVRSSSAF